MMAASSALGNFARSIAIVPAVLPRPLVFGICAGGLRLQTIATKLTDGKAILLGS